MPSSTAARHPAAPSGAPRRGRRRPVREAVFAGLVMVTVATVFAGCTVDGTARPTRDAAQLPGKGLDRFLRQTIDWGSCKDFVPDAEYPQDRSECGRFQVPVDYAAPDGATASIAVFRLKASQQASGIVLTNPGGPGASGVDYMAGTAADFAKMPVSQTLDFIGFDPRGIGRSTPAIRCQTDSERDAYRAEYVDNSPAGIARQEAVNTQIGRECVQRMGRTFLAHVGTADVIQDMDVLRAVLGFDKLNYLGYSYGTKIGGAYAEKYPNRVRAMINDGAVDPTADPVADIVNQSAGFQLAFNKFAADCATKPGCPLGADPAQFVARYHQLVRPLITTPAKTKDPRGLSFGDAITATNQALYSDTLWKFLRDGLTELTRGSGDTMLRLADFYEGRDRQGKYDNSSDAFLAIRCVDEPAITDQATLNKLDTTLRTVAPYRDDGKGTGATGKDACAFWPVPVTYQPHKLSIPELATTVVVSTTNDPATPYAAGVSLADQLKARLVTFRGTQHTASFEGNMCLDGPLTAYLVDLTLPTPGLTC
nr:alpha/beta hydrolase [Williamsia sp. CHRR-6]